MLQKTPVVWAQQGRFGGGRVVSFGLGVGHDWCFRLLGAYAVPEHPDSGFLC
jgi:hypothetical protein